ncbi:MAG TPA: hypothetical protein VMI94_28155 [Bryobacteraceae bacterium]|nr:hypothetical protein [Bryobacteraceae bacterium]
MGVSAIVVAALPIPAEAFRLVPAYTAQRGLLAVCTSLFAFLVLAFLFYSRHRIAGSMFCPGAGGCYAARPAAAWLPLVLILGSLAMVFCYQAELDASISLRRQTTQLIGITKADDILAGTAVTDIPRAIPLMVL